MSSQKWEKLDVTIVGRLAHYGNGICVAVPKAIVDAYGLKSGDNVRLTLEDFKRFGRPQQEKLG